MDILRVRFRTNAEFKEHYQDDLDLGGLFCPTTLEFSEGAQIIIELSAPALPNKILIRGVVRSWRPALPRLRVRAGATVEFLESESEKKDFLLQAISGEVGLSIKRKHVRLPVDLAVRYRTSESADMQDCSLEEISVGGALLATSEALPLETDVILEIYPPGSVRPIDISAKASYHPGKGATGLKFIYRDAAGNRRLKELIRRLRDN